MVENSYPTAIHSVEVAHPVEASHLVGASDPVEASHLVGPSHAVEAGPPVGPSHPAAGARHLVTPSFIPRSAEVPHPITPSVVHHIAEDDNIPVTPSSSTGPDLDVISYVPHLDTYFSPGRLFPIGVQISKNLCSQCGVSRPTKWCSHLRNAALKAGIPIRSLTQLRRNQRADKSKSGWKAPS